jgi:hypothetical protein
MTTANILSNRALNFTLQPITTYNAKEFPYSTNQMTISGPWNMHDSIILDLVLNQIFNGFCRKNLNGKNPKSWRNPALVELHQTQFKLNSYTIGVLSDIQKAEALEIKEIEKHLCSFGFSLNLLNIYKTYPVVMQRYQYTIKEICEKISTTKFSLNYKTKYIETTPTWGEGSEKAKIKTWGTLGDFIYPVPGENVFTAEVINDDTINVRRDGIDQVGERSLLIIRRDDNCYRLVFEHVVSSIIRTR